MNYRHAFHAGNFADLQKHAVLLWLLERMQQDAAPLTVIDTHAGRGLYDLEAGGARSPEAVAGIDRLERAGAEMPAPLAELRRAVRAMNADGPIARYPGSPWLAATRLRPGDRLVACELREEEFEILRETLAPHPAAEALHADGYGAALAVPAPRRLVLIDPPFERPDDYLRSAETATRLAARAGTVVAVWTPIKDMETFDGFLRRLGPPSKAAVTVAELRLRPLVDPMRMNGCAMVILNAPAGAAEALAPVCDWLARALGEAGARGEVWAL